MKHLNLRSLKSFHEIIQSGSATAAAKRLGLSQPGVSRLIAQLERDVGFDLFYREKGRLVPTADGLAVYEEVGLAFSNIERINALVHDIRTHNTGQLRIVSSPSFSEGILADVVASFRDSFPKVRLHIDSRSIETAKTQVATRAADCGFAKLPLDRPDIRAEKLITSDTVCVLPKRHPLAREATLSPLQLKDQPLILLGSGSWNRIQVEDAFRKARVDPMATIETHTVGSACAFASRGLGIAIVNELMAESFLRGNLVLRPFRPKIPHDFVFITSALTPMNRLTQTFLEETRKHFSAKHASSQ